MKTIRSSIAVLAISIAGLTIASAALSSEALAKVDDPLPSWNDGPAKQSIIDFVTKVTTPGSPDFAPVH